MRARDAGPWGFTPGGAAGGITTDLDDDGSLDPQAASVMPLQTMHWQKRMLRSGHPPPSLTGLAAPRIGDDELEADCPALSVDEIMQAFSIAERFQGGDLHGGEDASGSVGVPQGLKGDAWTGLKKWARGLAKQKSRWWTRTQHWEDLRNLLRARRVSDEMGSSSDDGADGNATEQGSRVSNRLPYVRLYREMEQVLEPADASEPNILEHEMVDMVARLQHGQSSPVEFLRHLASRSTDGQAGIIRRLATTAQNQRRTAERQLVAMGMLHYVPELETLEELHAAFQVVMSEALGDDANTRIFMLDRSRNCLWPVDEPSLRVPVAGVKRRMAQDAGNRVSLAAWAAHEQMVLSCLDVRGDLRYDPSVDGPADCCLSMPIWRNGTDGRMLGVLQVRKLQDKDGSGLRSTMLRDEEVFARQLSCVLGPLVSLLAELRPFLRQLEAHADKSEALQDTIAPLLQVVAEGQQQEQGGLIPLAERVEAAAAKLVGAQQAMLYFLDPASQALFTLTAQPGFDNGPEVFPLGAALCSGAVTSGTSMQWAMTDAPPPPADSRRSRLSGVPLATLLAVPVEVPWREGETLNPRHSLELARRFSRQFGGAAWTAAERLAEAELRPYDGSDAPEASERGGGAPHPKSPRLIAVLQVINKQALESGESTGGEVGSGEVAGFDSRDGELLQELAEHVGCLALGIFKQAGRKREMEMELEQRQLRVEFLAIIPELLSCRKPGQLALRICEHMWRVAAAQLCRVFLMGPLPNVAPFMMLVAASGPSMLLQEPVVVEAKEAQAILDCMEQAQEVVLSSPCRSTSGAAKAAVDALPDSCACGLLIPIFTASPAGQMPSVAFEAPIRAELASTSCVQDRTEAVLGVIQLAFPASMKHQVAQLQGSATLAYRNAIAHALQAIRAHHDK